MPEHNHKGFRGHFELDLLTLRYEGEVTLVRGCIPFSGITDQDARRRMEAAVDLYLLRCEEEGITPSPPTEKPRA